MKRHLFTMMCITVLAVSAPQTANAQLGNFLNKATKALKDANKALDPQNGNTAGNASGRSMTSIAAIPIPGGGEMLNPLANEMDVELVGAYGKSTSLNYGNVYLILKVRMNMNKSSVSFGSVNNVTGMAVDDEGNSHPINTMGAFPKNVTEGVFVKVVLDEKDLCFTDVKKSAGFLQLIRLGAFIDANHKDIITFKNVPILWDVNPE